VTALHPTPTRLALLAAVRDGRVQRYWPTLDDYDESRNYLKVNAAIGEFRRVGWVTHPSRDVGRPYSYYQLTTAGAEILAAGSTGGAS
jgi:hypothetical protein